MQDNPDKLIAVRLTTGEYVIEWTAPDGERGRRLGDDSTLLGMTTEQLDALSDEHSVASSYVPKYSTAECPNGFIFESQADAVRVIKCINLELYAWRSNTEVPDWCAIALSNGWTPPKGWTL
jgi:hypothetical protein